MHHFVFTLLLFYSTQVFSKTPVGYNNQPIADDINSIIESIANKYGKYNLELTPKTLRWYLYTIAHRESTFNAKLCNEDDGIGGDENWNKKVVQSHWPTQDHHPHGCGLTQITGWHHGGMPYPFNSAHYPKFVNKGLYGKIRPDVKVTKLSNPLNPKQNLERFLTEHVFPLYALAKRRYPNFSTEELLRVVSYHWNKGEYVEYDKNNTDYLELYDQYVEYYKSVVEEELINN